MVSMTSGFYHDPGIGNKETGNVRPVLIDICMDGSSNDRTGDIGTASGKGDDMYRPAERRRSPESRHFPYL